MPPASAGGIVARNRTVPPSGIKEPGLSGI